MVVCNDWHSALVPMFIHAEKSTNPGAFFQRSGQRPTMLPPFEANGPTPRRLSCATTPSSRGASCVRKVRRTRDFLRACTKSGGCLGHRCSAGLQAGLAEIFGVPQRYIDAITFKQPLRIGKYNEKAACAAVNRLVKCQTSSRPVCSHNKLHTGQVSAINTMAAGLRYSDRAAPSACSHGLRTGDCSKPLEQRSKLLKSKLDMGWHNRGCRKQKHGVCKREQIVSRCCAVSAVSSCCGPC